MTKRELKKRVKALEHTLGKFFEHEAFLAQRVRDLEEVVFDCADCMAPAVNTVPDWSAN